MAMSRKTNAAPADPVLVLSGLNDDGALEGAAARLAGTIGGTGSPIVAFAYQVDGGQTQNISFNQSTGAFDTALVLSEIGAGDHVITLTAVDAAGNVLTDTVDLVLDAAPPFIVADTIPLTGAQNIGSTFRPEVHFSRAVDAATRTADTFWMTDAKGDRIEATVRLSADGLKAWLFPAKAMPGATKITLHLDGAAVLATDGTPLDGDADGEDGGDFASTGAGAHLRGRCEFEVLHDGSEELQPSGIVSLIFRSGWQRRVIVPASHEFIAR